MRRGWLVGWLAVAGVGCAATVASERSVAQPTQQFPKPWGQPRVASPMDAPQPDHLEPGHAEPAEGDASQHLCCANSEASEPGRAWAGCQFIDPTAAAKNGCVAAGKTYKDCRDAQCAGDTCTCSN